MGPETKWPPKEMCKQSYKGFIWRKIVFSKTDVNTMIKNILRSSNQFKDDLKHYTWSEIQLCQNAAFAWIITFLQKTRCSDLLIVLHQRLTYTVFYISQSCNGWWYVPSCSYNELCGSKTGVPGPYHLGSRHDGSPTFSKPNHLALAWFNPDHYLDVPQ